jgi:hypothetical protein
VHVVLEIYAPIYQGPETNQAYGLVSGYGDVKNVAQGGAGLSPNYRNVENARLRNGLGATSYTCEANWR